MELIRESWNKSLSPSDFVEICKRTPDDDILESIVKHLLNLCSDEKSTNPLFFQYLVSSFTALGDKYLDVFTNIDEYNKIGIIRLCISNGDQFFIDVPLGTEHTARPALNLLKVCLTSTPVDLCVSAINKLAENPLFSVLIASARLFFNDEVQQMRPLLNERFPPIDLPPSLPFPITLLRRAMLTNDPTEPLLFTRHEIVTAVVSKLNMWSFVTRAFCFVRIDTFLHLYLHVVHDFIANPSLLLAYLTSNLFPRILNHFGDTDVPPIDQGATEFSLSDVTQVFDKIQKESEKSNAFSRPRERENCDFFNSLDDKEEEEEEEELDELYFIEELITTVPKSISDANIIETVYMYPSFSSTLIQYMMNKMVPENPSIALIYARQIFPVLKDFKWLLCQQGIFFEFISHCLKVIVNITDPEIFTELYFLPLSLLRSAWGVSSRTLRTRLEIYAHSPFGFPQYSYLLSLLFNIQPPTKKDASYTDFGYKVTPLSKCITVLEKLMNGSMNLIDILPQLRTNQYLWPSVLIWGIHNPSPDLKMLTNETIPNYYIVNFLFYSMMVGFVKPVRTYLCVAEHVDYDLLIKYRPNTIADINSIILDHLNLLARITPLTTDVLWDIVISWTAWVDIFGIKKFIHAILHHLIWKTMHSFIPKDSKHLFQTVAYIITILCNENSETIGEILSVVCQIAEFELDSMTSAIGLSQFSLILICTANEKWVEKFGKLLEFCIRILNDDLNLRYLKSVYALSAIKIALCTPCLQEKVTNEVFDVIHKLQDWQIMIDFFIVKHSLMSRQE